MFRRNLYDPLRNLRWVNFIEGEGEGEGAAGGGAGGAGGAGGEGAAAGDAGTGAGEGGGDAQFTWPENWRTELTGGDERLNNIAGRYNTPKDVFNAMVNAQDKLRSGNLKPTLPENPTESELKAWREENGIPDSPDKYDLTFDDGTVIGEEDKPLVDSFLGYAHEKNFTPGQVKDVVKWYYDNQQSMIDAQQDQDVAAAQQTIDALNVEWGREFRGNMNLINQTLEQFIPKDSLEKFMSARMADGTAVFNDPEFIKGLALLSRELNPAGVVVPAGGGDMMKGINEEIAQIEKDMRQNRKEYDKDEAKQARYRELIDARNSLQKRAS